MESQEQPLEPQVKTYLTLRLDPKLHADLKTQAWREQVSMNQFVTKALKRALRKGGNSGNK